MFVGLLLALLGANYPRANAQGPSPPMLLSGSVTLNGAPAPDGLNITAWDNGQVVGSVLTSGGQYNSLQACGQPDQNCHLGDSISFMLNGQLTAAQTATYQMGMPVTLDLTFTGTLQQATASTTTTTSEQMTTTSSSSITSTSEEMTTTSGTSSTSATQSTTESTSESMTTTLSGSSSSTVSSSASSASNSSTPAATSPKCLIATATYGSELAPEVQLLRNFRDHSIMKTQAGSNFMVAFNAWYYSFSPYVANYLANHWVERIIMKGVLYPLIGILFLSQGLFSVASPYPEIAALISGLLASSLIGAFYLGLPIGLLRAKVRRLYGWRHEKLFGKMLALMLLVGVVGLIVGEVGGLKVGLMFSSAAVVLSTLFLSALLTSVMIKKRLQTG